MSDTFLVLASDSRLVPLKNKQIFLWEGRERVCVVVHRIPNEAIKQTWVHYSAINVRNNAFSRIKGNLVVDWDAFISNATKHL